MIHALTRFFNIFDFYYHIFTVYLYKSLFSGFNGACSVHEWKGIFQNQNVIFKMTSVCGHVMSLDFPVKYNNWDRVDPVSMFQV